MKTLIMTTTIVLALGACSKTGPKAPEFDKRCHVPGEPERNFAWCGGDDDDIQTGYLRFDDKPGYPDGVGGDDPLPDDGPDDGPGDAAGDGPDTGGGVGEPPVPGGGGGGQTGGQNPGNDKPVGGSPFDGERGEEPSGKKKH